MSSLLQRLVTWKKTAHNGNGQVACRQGECDGHGLSNKSPKHLRLICDAIIFSAV